MADRYLHLTGTAPGRFLARHLGLPHPVELVRWSPEQPLFEGELLFLTAGDSTHTTEALAELLPRTGMNVTRSAHASSPAVVVLDATGVSTVDGLAGVHAALHPVVRNIRASGRVLVVGVRPSDDDPEQAAVQQALEGFVRSLAKELGHGRTAQLLRIDPGRVAGAESTLRFLTSPKSAYVSGQVIQLGPGAGAPAEVADRDRPLAGRTALVTGAARGIGAAVAATLARDGARVVCLDMPQVAQDLERTAVRVGGSALALDITAPDAAERITEHLARHATEGAADGAATAAAGGAATDATAPGGAVTGGATADATATTGAATGDSSATPAAVAPSPASLDILVHNAGITRDKRLLNMRADTWSSVLDVNLGAVIRTTQALVKSGVLGEGSRIVATSSVAGIAGNAGQTHYAASKAGVAGLVRALAPVLATYGITVNAVAPGFIETRMTTAIPLLLREAGRRLNSLSQSGRPEDVAETTAWLAHPGSSAVNGQVVRVCGQSLLGA